MTMRLRCWLVSKILNYFPELALADDLQKARKEVFLIESRLRARGADFKKEQAAKRKIQQQLNKANSQLRGKCGQVKKMAKELYSES